MPELICAITSYCMSRYIFFGPRRLCAPAIFSQPCCLRAHGFGAPRVRQKGIGISEVRTGNLHRCAAMVVAVPCCCCAHGICPNFCVVSAHMPLGISDFTNICTGTLRVRILQPCEFYRLSFAASQCRRKHRAHNHIDVLRCGQKTVYRVEAGK